MKVRMNQVMQNSRDFFKKCVLQSNSGIALLLVIGAITILIFLLADFTFETKLNKIKVYNQQDKAQARLNAESGLNLAIAKLKLYQVARNKLEKEASAKTAFPPNDLEAILLQPFVYPISLPKTANIIQKTALSDFEKTIIFRGELNLTMTKLSGFLNPNALRIEKKTNSNASQQDEDQASLPNDPENPEEDTQSGQAGGQSTNKDSQLIIYNKLTETLTRLMKDKSDNDENFHSKYSNLRANELVDEIRFYVNDPNQLEGIDTVDAENRFNQKKITPKHAPMSSIDELYLLPSWDDEIVNLIKDRLSVHEVSIISINEITIEDLKIIFPAINDVQIEEFFKYRDGDPDKKIEAQKFKSAEDFKNVVTGTLNIVTDSEYNTRIEELQKAGLRIDTAGKIYKAISRGIYNNSTYNLIAYIDLPVKPSIKKAKKKGSQTPPVTDEDSIETGPDGSTAPPPASDSTKKEDEKPEPLELMAPRVIEVRLE